MFKACKAGVAIFSVFGSNNTALPNPERKTSGKHEAARTAGPCRLGNRGAGAGRPWRPVRCISLPILLLIWLHWRKPGRTLEEKWAGIAPHNYGSRHV